MKTEQILFTRYDLEDVTSNKQATNLYAVITRSISSSCSKVIYRKTAVCDAVRIQAKFYDLNKAIELFEKKVKSADARFLDAWEKNLKVLIELRVLKVEALKIEKLKIKEGK